MKDIIIILILLLAIELNVVAVSKLKRPFSTLDVVIITTGVIAIGFCIIGILGILQIL